MKCRNKSILTISLLLVFMLLISGCSGEQSPYDLNDAENYNVSIRFDANGGLFTTNTSLITDSFNISDMKTNNAGQVEIPLIAPDDARRGKEGFTPYNNGYFLAGWYAERVETADDQGNISYTYSEKWDFDTDRVKVHAGGSYQASEPVLTLYAAWIPMFEIEFYSTGSGDYLDTLTFDPSEMIEFEVPMWDTNTGAIDMKAFPKKDGYTFNGVYLDKEGTEAVEADVITHIGTVNYENGTSSNGSMKLYVDWLEGEWYHIYTAEQFVKNAKPNGNYVIHADLDFSDVIWPTALMHGNFTGTVEGNGFTFKNISATQTNNSRTSSGLFGQLKNGATITDLKIENANFTIKGGARVSGACFGLFAGQIDDSAVVTNVLITGSTLTIDTGAAFLSDDYSIGLVCGIGNDELIDASGISCIAGGENPDTLKITQDGTSVRVEKIVE